LDGGPLFAAMLKQTRRQIMISAIVLLTVERDKINKVADAVTDIEGVSEVFSLAGRYDLAAIIRVKSNDDLAKIVTERIRGIAGISSSETLIAFQVYSRHDLERMFSIGLEKA
jgi:DNA-binding Lrp family transcriptional regulator